MVENNLQKRIHAISTEFQKKYGVKVLGNKRCCTGDRNTTPYKGVFDRFVDAVNCSNIDLARETAPLCKELLKEYSKIYRLCQRVKAVSQGRIKISYVKVRQMVPEAGAVSHWRSSDVRDCCGENNTSVIHLSTDKMLITCVIPVCQIKGTTDVYDFFEFKRAMSRLLLQYENLIRKHPFSIVEKVLESDEQKAEQLLRRPTEMPELSTLNGEDEEDREEEEEDEEEEEENYYDEDEDYSNINEHNDNYSDY